jgi:CubicO group peptidase (beta-lactamase class C family)
MINTKLKADLNDYSHKIDSIYQHLTLEQKIKSILITVNNKGVDKDTIRKSSLSWIDIDNLYDFIGVQSPILSDVMIRSAILGDKQGKLLADLLNILINRGGDGFSVSKHSPYSLAINPKDTDRGLDFFLESYGKLVLPFKDQSNNMKCFIANTYHIPEKITASRFYTRKSTDNLLEGEMPDVSSFISSLKWKELGNILKEYETPSLEIILQYGGLIYSTDSVKDLMLLKKIFNKNFLPEAILEKSCKKSLLIRELGENKPVVDKAFNVDNSLLIFERELLKSGMVLLENKNIIPLNKLSGRKIASIHIGERKTSSFQEYLTKYADIDHFNHSTIPDLNELFDLKHKTENYNTIIVGVNGDWYDNESNNSLYNFLHQISISAELILVHFGSGNRLAHLPVNHPFKAVVLSFTTNEVSQNIAAQIIFGGIGAKGVLAKDINNHFNFGDGYSTNKCRLGYNQIYNQQIIDSLQVIDQIANEAIEKKATPGCQVLVAKSGDIIYNRSFGHHTYHRRKAVKTTDLYDIASVTKIISSIPAVMKMHDEKRIHITDNLSLYIPRLQNTNKSQVKIEDVLLHQAGFKSWIPFYLNAIDKDKLNGDIYSKKYSWLYNVRLDSHVYFNKTVRFRNDIFHKGKKDKFTIQVSDKWYMNADYYDSITYSIDTSQVDEKPIYRYSDLGYYYLKEIIESSYNMPLNEFVESKFFKPLGANRMLYKPLEVYRKKEIIPTEDDKVWRKELLHGHVHDPGAAMLGGVGGHAGVFSNAEDLAKILQMYLNKGSYGGEYFIDSATIQRFTSTVRENNRRGLGFDKPVLDSELSGPCSKEASLSSYGHSGFTGTLVWVDPEYDLIYVFLSNRIHPNQHNKTLIKEDIRTRIQTAIYHALPEYWQKMEEL